MRQNIENIKEGFKLMSGQQLPALRHHKEIFSQKKGKKRGCKTNWFESGARQEHHSRTVK
jgi:hypothetical protein